MTRAVAHDRGTRRAAPALTLQVATRSRRLPAPARLRRWARAALAQPARVTLRIVGEREGESLNREFRRKRYATNVLTFCYDEAGCLAGDVVLCATVIAREARAQAKTLDAHYAHLTVHGLLHLQGYDHQHPRDARIMEAKEVSILRSLGFGNPYAMED
ncbi:MAG: rRNA maturation RNase YbeY [Betaproteobacteria bacterium RIFCSPLOWO2_12_FULL_65_110]|nr:MAG: rRNA maturation RNase YbeY [Betaproteobacteria bacterium RIFCSPLOWO2_12_FULL_65_110]